MFSCDRLCSSGLEMRQWNGRVELRVAWEYRTVAVVGMRLHHSGADNRMSSRVNPQLANSLNPPYAAPPRPSSSRREDDCQLPWQAIAAVDEQW